MQEQVHRDESDLGRQFRNLTEFFQVLEGDHQIFEQNNTQARINSSIEENHCFQQLIQIAYQSP